MTTVARHRSATAAPPPRRASESDLLMRARPFAGWRADRLVFDGVTTAANTQGAATEVIGRQGKCADLRDIETTADRLRL